MKIWQNAFLIWKNFCPYYRRRLLTREDLLSWAEDAKIISDFGHENEHFKFFINLLLEIGVLCPITKSGALLDPRYYEDPEVIHISIISKPKEFELYHPIQFFEVINWFLEVKKFLKLFNKNDDYWEYYNLRLLEMKINDIKKTIRQLNYHKIDTSYSKETLIEYQEKYNSITKEYPKGEELRKLLKIPLPIYKLNESKLESWIKIESLIAPIGTEILAPMNINLVPTKKLNENNVNDFLRDYKIWIKNIFENHGNYINQEEIKLIENWADDLYRGISDDKSPVSSNWLDLIELTSPHLRQKFKGEVSYFLNLHFIRRNIIRFYWKLMKKNLRYIGHPPKKPHFFFEDRNEYILYLRSILLFFGLNPFHNFILYVPGKTEQVILEVYVDRRWLKFSIKNMEGEDKPHFYKKVCEDIGDREFFFLFDFHDLRQYNEKLIKYGENCTFFYPDFITENFTVKQVFDAFLSIANDLELNLSEGEKGKIQYYLNEEKNKSNQIIEELTRQSNLSNISAKGFEKVIINYLRNSYPRQIILKFPWIKLDENGYITDRDQKKKLKQEIKKMLAENLKVHVSKSLEEDPDRKQDKFPFEMKLEPFVNNMLNIINVAAYWSSN